MSLRRQEKRWSLPKCPECSYPLRREGARWWCQKCEDYRRPDRER